MPFLICTVNLVGQQAGGLKILQGFLVTIFQDVYGTNTGHHPHRHHHHHHQQHLHQHHHHSSEFGFWAAVGICFVRLVAAVIAAKYIKNFG